MKTILNWRYGVILALLSGGLLTFARAFGDPSLPMTDAGWFLQFALSVILGAICFLLLTLCIRRWERRGQIPDFTDFKNK